MWLNRVGSPSVRWTWTAGMDRKVVPRSGGHGNREEGERAHASSVTRASCQREVFRLVCAGRGGTHDCIRPGLGQQLKPDVELCTVLNGDTPPDNSRTLGGGWQPN